MAPMSASPVPTRMCTLRGGEPVRNVSVEAFAFRLKLIGDVNLVLVSALLHGVEAQLEGLESG